MLDQAKIEETRAKCKTLHGFIREAWHVLEPSTPFIDGWHIGAIAEHLEAISKGQITRLQINQPPGTMKSLTASVMWQAWEWGPFSRPDLRYFTTSYLDDYAKRDARKTRDLINSEWFQTHWPLKLLREAEMSFENEYRGNREAMPFASLTAGRGNRLIIDDPHSTEQVESDAERKKAERIFRESVPSRLNDPAKDAILVIMHRLHVHDICGVIETLGLPYEKLILPMEFEPDRRCVTSIGFADPRTKERELLFPERFPREVLDRDKKQLTSHAYAGQYQQRPSLREGGIFKRHWFAIAARAPESAVRVRRWDLAATVPSGTSDPDYSAGVKMSRSTDGRFYVEDVKRFRASALEVRRTIKATAVADGVDVALHLPQDPGQAGKDQAQSMIAEFAGFNVRAHRETGSKETRAEPFAAQCEAGNVFLVAGGWNEAFIDELCDFPAGHDDQVDAASGAFVELLEDDIPNIRLDADTFHRVNPAKVGERTISPFGS